MERDAVKPYQNEWFIIADNNYSYRFSSKEEAVESNRKARYYVRKSYAYHTIGALGQRFNFNSYKVYDKDFVATTIRVGEFECVKISEEEWTPSVAGSTRMGFSIADANSKRRKVWFSYGIKAIKGCIEFLQDDLSQFSSWLEYDVYHLTQEVIALKIENQALKQELEKFRSSKDRIKELYQLLFEEKTDEI